MAILLIFLVLTGACLYMALRKKQFLFLLVPVLSMFVYFIVQIILVPAPILDTIKFIFALR